MIRYLLLFFLGLLVYYSLRTALSPASRSSGRKQRQQRMTGQDMVLDPECNTYVVKERAVARRMHGEVMYFCSDSCARKHEEKDRS
ncbi:MAG: hypothetical protein A2X56_07060 [Nitrospirae bacterium GWC2_57_13]|jgi:YHS domain-containing protein|nr:MAG: hypothetical protein A2X56_07060 [Nitrospirae bacterium GWC2_57_13]HAR44767.1 hypothetical protein [Nitrospiraceae bacterium]